MDRTILDKAVSYVETNNMITDGDRIVVGVSGGADSVCLLFLLYTLREKYNLKLYVVHVHHGIREEAGDDAAFVEQLCDRFAVNYELIREDVPARAAEWRMSEEEAGRKVRYEAFGHIGEKYGCTKIAVAHNMNDEAETVLFHLFRGSGLHGLTGIPCMRKQGDFLLIRPILCLERHEIEKILTLNKLGWVTDKTNLEDKYARNRIRHNILTEADKIASGTVRHICEVADKLSETESLLAELEDECLRESIVDRKSVGGGILISINAEAIARKHPVIQKRAVLSCLKEVTGGGKDIGTLQVEQVMELIGKPGNRRLNLARGVSAERRYDNIVISKDYKNSDSAEITVEYLKLSDMETDINGLLKFVKDIGEVNKYTKLLDYDKIDERLVVRNRQKGDYLFIMGPDGEYHRKSLKDYMIDVKIPAGERDDIKVVAAGQHCVWLVGYRISDYCRLTENTVNLVRLSAKVSEI